MQEGRKWYLRLHCIKRRIHFFFTFFPVFLNISELKGLYLSNMVQSVRMNQYCDICQNCHLRPYCIQPTNKYPPSRNLLPSTCHWTYLLYLAMLRLNVHIMGQRSFATHSSLNFHPISLKLDFSLRQVLALLVSVVHSCWTFCCVAVVLRYFDLPLMQYHFACFFVSAASVSVLQTNSSKVAQIIVINWSLFVV